MFLARRIRPAISTYFSFPQPLVPPPNRERRSISGSYYSVDSTDTRRDRDSGGETIGRRLLRLIYPKRSAVIALQKWLEEGKRLQKYQLNRVVRELRKQKRFKHALEVPRVLLEA